MSANGRVMAMSAAKTVNVARVPGVAAALMGLILLCAPAVRAQDLKEILDLRGKWKLELGDDQAWGKPGFPDQDWAAVNVPGPWENQGFPGYDGYGWYRKWFYMPVEWKGKRLFLDLGCVDDVDETYINGQFVAYQGEFPPDYVSRYGMQRRYAIPLYVLKPGENNLIAVRVYDSQMAGGITQGKVRILEDRNPLTMAQTLEGQWKIHTGDDLGWKEDGTSERGWTPVQVPAFWETQGLKGYDGFAWYRKTFTLDPRLENERLILFLGKIDDFDEVYLNGQRVGRTGSFPEHGDANGGDNDFTQWRAYTLAAGALKKGTNIIAVRVFDKYFHGGIYEGPIGLVRRDTYLAWEKHQPKENNTNFNSPWRWLEWLFN
jgi:sialate O-acetylesterase